MPEKSLSANTLFHFTKSLNNLESILKNEFKVNYCLEDWSNIFSDLDGEDEYEVYIPMVCFCDIPLSQIHYHSNYYGEYAIGLTKTWGIKNQINPVLYVHENTKFSKPMSNILNQCTDRLIKAFLVAEKINSADIKANMTASSPDIEDTFSNLQEALESIPLLQYLKAYEGRLWRYDKYIEGVRFYDEKEWRYVAESILPIMKKTDEKVNNHILENNDQLVLKPNLSFEPNDIRYIIVNKEAEVLEMKDMVEKIKSSYSHDDVLRLATKIISMDQIREDF